MCTMDVFLDVQTDSLNPIFYLILQTCVLTYEFLCRGDVAEVVL